MAQVVVGDESRGFGGGSIREFPDARVRRLKECAPGVKNLDQLTFDLKPDRARCHVPEYGSEMDVKAGALAGRYVDLLNIDHAIRQVRGQEMLSFDRRHAEY